MTRFLGLIAWGWCLVKRFSFGVETLLNLAAPLVISYG